MKDFVLGFVTPWVVYGVIFILHLVLPARNVIGYVRDEHSGELLKYRLSGFEVFTSLVLLWIVLGLARVVPWDWLYVHRWGSLAGSFVIGLVFSIAVFVTQKPTGRSLVADFYFGRALNLQFLRKKVDVKMFLYLVGAAMLGLNLLSFTVWHVQQLKSNYSPGVILYCVLFMWFVLDYLYFEHVHLYTYDIFAERVGFKLGWGCLTFYPYFYLVGLWAVADRPNPGLPIGLVVLYCVIFFAGWILSRGANLQKYYFKVDPQKRFLGLIAPKTVGGDDRLLLCSGFWGIARHVNYLGEILMSIGLTLTLGWPGYWVPWLYTLYYIFLLLPRERADERRCREKYGAAWLEYTKKVPRRIVPWLY